MQISMSVVMQQECGRETAGLVKNAKKKLRQLKNGAIRVTSKAGAGGAAAVVASTFIVPGAGLVGGAAILAGKFAARNNGKKFTEEGCLVPIDEHPSRKSWTKNQRKACNDLYEQGAAKRAHEHALKHHDMPYLSEYNRVREKRCGTSKEAGSIYKEFCAN
jgi:hypothetical protein